MSFPPPVAALSWQGTFAQALLCPDHLPLPGLRLANGSDPGPRVAVYRNNVQRSLINALAQTFPVTEQLVGAAFFQAMAACFVQRHPPNSPILSHYGAEFPAFVAQFEPVAQLHYLPDLARLEFARVLAYHAGDTDPIDQETIGRALAMPEMLPLMQLQLHPSVQTIASSHGIVSLWQAHQHEGEQESVDITQDESVLVLRHGLDVLVLQESPGTVAFVAAVKEGIVLGEAAETAAVHPSFDLSAVFSRLLSFGAICALRASHDPL